MLLKRAENWATAGGKCRLKEDFLKIYVVSKLIEMILLTAVSKLIEMILLIAVKEMNSGGGRQVMPVSRQREWTLDLGPW